MQSMVFLSKSSNPEVIKVIQLMLNIERSLVPQKKVIIMTGRHFKKKLQYFTFSKVLKDIVILNQVTIEIGTLILAVNQQRYIVMYVLIIDSCLNVFIHMCIYTFMYLLLFSLYVSCHAKHFLPEIKSIY